LETSRGFNWLLVYILESSSAGRFILARVDKIEYRIETNSILFDGGNVSSFEPHHLGESLISWRAGAIGFSRNLMLYSAVFLITLVMFFTLLAGIYRHDKRNDTSKDPYLEEEIVFLPIKEESEEVCLRGRHPRFQERDSESKCASMGGNRSRKRVNGTRSTSVPACEKIVHTRRIYSDRALFRNKRKSGTKEHLGPKVLLRKMKTT